MDNNNIKKQNALFLKKDFKLAKYKDLLKTFGSEIYSSWLQNFFGKIIMIILLGVPTRFFRIGLYQDI